MNALLTFDFSIGHYNGTMSMKIMSGNRVLLDQRDFRDKKFSITAEIKWPDTVYFVLENKGPYDTEVGPSGEIIKDKFIKLESVTVDRMPVHIVALLDCVEIDTGQEILKTNYWGFNGIARITFDKEDTMSWHLNNMIKVSDKDKNRKSVITEHHDNAGMGTIY